MDNNEFKQPKNMMPNENNDSAPKMPKAPKMEQPKMPSAPNPNNNVNEKLMKQGFAPKGWKPGDNTSGITKISELNFNNPYRKKPKVSFGFGNYHGNRSLEGYNDDLSKLIDDVKSGRKINSPFEKNEDNASKLAYYLNKNGVLNENEIPEQYKKEMSNYDFSLKHDIPYYALLDEDDNENRNNGVRSGYGQLLRNIMGRGWTRKNKEKGDKNLDWDEDLYQSALLDFNKNDPYKTKQLQHMFLLYPGLKKTLNEKKYKQIDDPKQGKYYIRDWGSWGDDFEDYYDDFLFGLQDAYDRAYRKKYSRSPYGDDEIIVPESENKQMVTETPKNNKPDLEALRNKNFDKAEEVELWLDKNYPGIGKQEKEDIIKQWWQW